MSQRPLVTVRGLSKSYRSAGKKIAVLDDLSLTVDPGETLAIMGSSGSGKSSLLALLAGLDKPDLGEIFFKDFRVDSADESGLSLWRRRSVGFIFQSFELLAHLTALENASLPLEILGFSRRESRNAAGKALESLGIGARAEHFPSQLSGGEQQRAAIARAFVHGPDIVFADEPTGNLDETSAESVAEALLAATKARGASLVLVTHNPLLAKRLDRTLRLSSGRLA